MKDFIETRLPSLTKYLDAAKKYIEKESQREDFVGVVGGRLCGGNQEKGYTLIYNHSYLYLDENNVGMVSGMIHKPERIEYIQIKNDLYGNPRYIIHQRYLPKDKEAIRDFGGKKYRNKGYEYFYVFSTYNIQDLVKNIKKYCG